MFSATYGTTEVVPFQNQTFTTGASLLFSLRRLIRLHPQHARQNPAPLRRKPHPPPPPAAPFLVQLSGFLVMPGPMRDRSSWVPESSTEYGLDGWSGDVMRDTGGCENEGRDAGSPDTGPGYFASFPDKRNVMVPQNRRARICTGRCRSSSVYQIQMLPRFLTTPASAVGCTRTVLNVPTGVLISSLPSTFMVTGTVCMASTTGMTKLLPTTMGWLEA